MDLEMICHKVAEAARLAGSFIRDERKKFEQSEVIEKGQRNLVSYVDVTAEKIITEELKKILPAAGFLTEEETVSKGNESLRWIIDPLDGTTNFIHNIPVYCVSIALAEKNELQVGVVYEINLDECFYAWKNGGAFLNGKKISVTTTPKLRNALCATGFPYEKFPLLDRYFSTLKFLFQNSHGIRRMGSAAIDLVYVACGRFDAFYEYQLNAWDVAAGALIVKEAGGIVSDFEGGEDYLFGKEIIASNGELYNEFLNVVVNPPGT